MAHEVEVNFEANGKQKFFIADNDFDNKLIEAVKQNNLEKIKETFFKAQYNKKLLDHDGKSLVMIAVEKAISDDKYIETLNSLLDRDCASNILDKTNLTPLHVAAKAGKLIIVETLLKSQILNIDKHHPDHGTALFAAITKGHLEIVKLLIQNGAQPFPIKEVIESNSVEILKYLIEHLKNGNSKLEASINEKLLREESFQKFNTITKYLIEQCIESKTNSSHSDKIKILVNHIAQYGNSDEFNNLCQLEAGELIKKQLLDYSLLELAVQYNNLSIVEEVIYHTLIHSDVPTIKNLL